MMHKSWKPLLASPAVVVAFLAAAGSAGAVEAVAPEASSPSPAFSTHSTMVLAQAAPETGVSNVAPASMTQISQYTAEGRGNRNAMDQITSVSQLTDVQPTDWAFQALQSLVDRYGCIQGYPNRTYRGNRALSRYEFAAGLNACMDRVNDLIAQGTADLVKKSDLATLQRLQEEFAAELATLRGRVDALEARTAKLEAQQFSTTTKLQGEAVFAVSGTTNPTGVSNNIVFTNRVRLNLVTSFTGEDSLVTRLQVGNFGGFALPGGTSEGTQTFNFGSGGPGFILDTLNYSFPLGKSARIVLEANAGDWADFIPTLNPFFEDFDGGNGSLSAFGQRNPIYRVANGSGAGIGFTWDLNKQFNLSGGYMANVTGASPAASEGLFTGSYSAMAQLTFKPTDRFAIGLAYNRAYFTGSAPSIFNSAVGTSPANFAGSAPSTSDSFGASATWRVSPGFNVSGWVSFFAARPTAGGADTNMISYAIALAFPDLGKKGSVGGLLFGAQPYVTGGPGLPVGSNTPFHIEGFYKYQLTDNISITPGVIWLTAPNQGATNGVLIGTVRTTFLF